MTATVNGEVTMHSRPLRPMDLLGELRHEERWLCQIAAQSLQATAATAATAGLDDLLAELRAAFALRRRLQAQLAERELQELTGGVVLDRDDEEASLADAEQRQAG